MGQFVQFGLNLFKHGEAHFIIQRYLKLTEAILTPLKSIYYKLGKSYCMVNILGQSDLGFTIVTNFTTEILVE